jgi:lysozyme family protein
MGINWTFEGTKRGYSKLWKSIAIKKGKDAENADRFARRIIAAEARYKGVQKAIGVPWYFIGALHMRESSNSFNGVLHNGDQIIGTGRKTYRVPKGRGPFSTWEESAIDALKLKNLDEVSEWSAERMGFEAELFNGIGYVARGVNSAYVWAGSNHEQTGKYVADHVWDGDFDDPQIGVMTVLKRLCEIRPDIADQLYGSIPPPDIEPTEPKPGIWSRIKGWLS